MRLMTTASLEIAPLSFPIRPCNHTSGHSRPASEVAGLCISDPPTSSWMGTSVSQMAVSGPQPVIQCPPWLNLLV
jgi:hypothetical protein